MTEVGMPLGFMTKETSYWFGKARPKRTDREVIAIAAEKLTKELMQWAEETDNTRREEYLNDAIYVISLPSNDGYALARKLENRGYDPDAELVELLDDIYYTLEKALAQSEKDWVRLNDIQPKLALNTKVSIGETTGIITEIREETGYYKISYVDGKSSRIRLVVFENVPPVKED